MSASTDRGTRFALLQADGLPARPPGRTRGRTESREAARREAAPVRDERCGTRDAVGLRAACLALYCVSAPKIAGARRETGECENVERFHGLFMVLVDAWEASSLERLRPVSLSSDENAERENAPLGPSPIAPPPPAPCHGPAGPSRVFRLAVRGETLSCESPTERVGLRESGRTLKGVRCRAGEPSANRARQLVPPPTLSSTGL